MKTLSMLQKILPLLFLAALNTAIAAEDDLCAQLKIFASKSSEQNSEVRLKTFWGVRKFNDQLIWGEKQCKNDENPSSKQLCDFLLKHSSTEFPEMNFRRVLKCLQGKDPFDKNTSIKISDIELTFYEVPSFDPNVVIDLSLLRKDETTEMRIKSKRYDTNID